jgi:hypothetical protein
MKTFLVVALLMLLALGALAGLVVPSRAGQSSGGLFADCTPPAVPRGVPTLLHCRFIVTNTGPEPLPEARLAFQPAPDLPIPDRYFFFREWIDGVEQQTTGTDITYDIGTLPARGQRVVELDVIVISTHESGADAVLIAGADGTELSRVRLQRDVVEARPELALKVAERPGDSAPASAQFAAFEGILDAPPAEIQGIDVQIAPGYKWAVTSGGKPFGTGIQREGDGLYGLYAAHFDGDGVGPGFRFIFDLESAAGVCLPRSPVVVMTVHMDARDETLAAFGDAPSSCEGDGAGGDISLPATGGGPPESNSRWPVVPVVRIAVASAMLLVGAVARRRCDAIG